MPGFREPSSSLLRREAVKAAAARLGELNALRRRADAVQDVLVGDHAVHSGNGLADHLESLRRSPLPRVKQSLRAAQEKNPLLSDVRRRRLAQGRLAHLLPPASSAAASGQAVAHAFDRVRSRVGAAVGRGPVRTEGHGRARVLYAPEFVKRTAGSGIARLPLV
ncbi:hypothetical protein SACE_2817 [Saccharopolyspora erythraea NRRL 2338]|uniref:Uncharacterized protein n=1 Tax=Saccharopolyspora erythraea (strain ATCC 11635 / DSM 40517 / JCM 4748 / NBRC 13426 / NCIMB 8594 / NRRL 2338) TaxID=405948 RepID=A4FDH1_SACEN|nr:hypothetical protein SACE_2817 [Saccharopolyspora erythraea NRRL 2338]